MKTILASMLALACFAQPAGKVEPPPVRIFVGPGKAVTVTVPAIAKDDLVNIVSGFFSQRTPENLEVKRKLQAVFGQSTDLTFVLTTKREE